MKSIWGIEPLVVSVDKKKSRGLKFKEEDGAYLIKHFSMSTSSNLPTASPEGLDQSFG